MSTSDIQTYVTARFEKLDRQATEIKEAAIEMAVALATQCKEPVYTRVLERILAAYMETPSEQITSVIRRITTEEVHRANA